MHHSMPHRTLPAQCIYVPRVIPTRIVIVSVTESWEMYVICEVTNRCTSGLFMHWQSAACLPAPIQLDAMHNKKSGFRTVAMCHGVFDNRRFEGRCHGVFNNRRFEKRCITVSVTTDVLNGPVSRGFDNRRFERRCFTGSLITDVSKVVVLQGQW